MVILLLLENTNLEVRCATRSFMHYVGMVTEQTSVQYYCIPKMPQ